MDLTYMITSILYPNPAPSTVAFPKLMKLCNQGNTTLIVVVFMLHAKSLGKGVVICSNANAAVRLAVGSVCEDWDMNQFEDYNGTITLQNKI